MLAKDLRRGWKVRPRADRTRIAMRNNMSSLHRSVRICLSILLVSAVTVATRAQSVPDFSGVWKQDNERCQPKRSGDVTLHIEQHDPDLTVETSITHGSNSGHAVQKYTTDGKVSVSTGADGDEFHTSVVWKGSSLVFTIEEHEDGRILHSQETWSLIENGATLQRIRERPNGEKQVLIYSRQQSGGR
jgi:hypothetical protein